MLTSSLPRLLESAKVAVITGNYPPIPGGSSVIMRNLLSCFHPDSCSVITARNCSVKPIANGNAHRIYHVKVAVNFSDRAHRISEKLQAPYFMRRVLGAIEKIRPGIIMGVYPELDFLAAAEEAARHFGIPWVAYLHDTIVEGLSGTPLMGEAAALQERVFNSASSILVMSRGMADLYRRKYGIDCKPLEHCYLEPIPSELSEARPLRQAFWGGAVYAINVNGVRRVSKALDRSGLRFQVAANNTAAGLRRIGLCSDNIECVFYPERKVYLDQLKTQGILVLALDWPDESPVHEDELSTVFPTKTVEYLASGRPILVHCPPHYFLADFFRRYGCGLVVDVRDIGAIEDAVSYLSGGDPAVRNMRMSALHAARIFSANRIGGLLKSELERLAGSTTIRLTKSRAAQIDFPPSGDGPL